MNSSILLKIGGRAFKETRAFAELADAIKCCKSTHITIVHGGGAEITKALEKANRKAIFVDGIRVTKSEDIKIVEDVLSRNVNERIASLISEQGVATKRMSGRTKGLFTVEKMRRNGQDFGFVGNIINVKPKVVFDSLSKNKVPVISPISEDNSGKVYNVNADSAAAALAVSLECTDLVYFTDVPGIKDGNVLYPSLKIRKAKELIKNRTITEGMVPKMESAFFALNGGVSRVHIARWDGKETLENIILSQPKTGTAILK